MKNAALLFLSLITGSASWAQYDPAKISRKAVDLYNKALQQATDNQFREGIQTLEEAVRLSKDYEDAYLSMAGMYGELKEYKLSVENYQKAKAIDSFYFQDYNLPYSINLAGLGLFRDALDAIHSFLSISNHNEVSRRSGEYRQQTYEFALEYQARHPEAFRFEPRNLGDSVNSAVSEYYPTLTIEGNTLIFTRRVNNNNEDFFITSRTPSGWTRARPLEGNINTDQNEGAQNISQDGQWLVFTGCNFPEGLGSCDLYISYLTTEGWSAPENLGPTVNTEFWESAPSLSPDKRDLYFASRRPGNLGGSDLYVTHRLPSGRWTLPENLGPTINTPGDEGTPFMHADNQTLYFTSNGHPGYGGDDLFFSQKLPGGGWTKPQNLGFPINTIENEGSLVVGADGKTAYYASDRADSRGGLDLYTFELPAADRPFVTRWVKGKVFDQKTGKGLPSLVELTDLSNREKTAQVQTDETGNYLITIPVGREYAFEVRRRGYLIYSEHFGFHAGEAGDSASQIDIPLQPIQANATVVLKNIFFDLNSYALKPESAVELEEIVQLLKDNPALVIQIQGHTDNLGKAAENIVLSQNRAKAVVAYLAAKGISASRLSAKGWGDTRPLDTNQTEAGRARNRRTELTVLANP